MNDEMETVIKAENIGKKYIISHQNTDSYSTLRDTVAQGAKNIAKKIARRPSVMPRREEFWALKDVSFEIKQGDRVGIIGRNGAGKSTLLKVLSRITNPTTGQVTLHGRVASLLEVGTGFHPELTGRENIFLNGAILGMNRAEIEQKFDEIVAFAEIEKFLDTPVKRYSSGMYVRLAFAVAAHLEPEILIVDEVLAVGDAQFQKKCLGKMEEVGKSGRTVIFVSHNLAAIRRLCNKAIWLDGGTSVKQGAIDDVIDEYYNSFGPKKEFKALTFEDSPDKAMQFKNVSVTFENAESNPKVDSSISFEMEVITREIVEGAYLTVNVMDLFDSVIYWTADIGSKRYQEPKVGKSKISCKMPPYLLNPGRYSVNFGITCLGRGTVYSEPNKRIEFEIKEDSGFVLAAHGIDRPGYSAIPSKWE